MTTAPKAIDTRYAGCLFRSRLEARWAVAFDVLGLQWEYEPEGFELSDGARYLPDFWLPQVNGGCWIEVKPFTPGSGFCVDPKAEAFGRSLCTENGNPFSQPTIYQLNGLPPADEDRDERGWGHCPYSKGVYRLSFFADSPHDWCICNKTGEVGIQFDALGDRITDDPGSALSANHPRLTAAWTAARSARFEHGCSGR